ncbi:MAG TPA: hypothetical protein VK717_04955 [Opitutaceae bacterium]|jgi:hypothetical protein|nr:hypothetical protein [Opitutaceae bacterium]
MNRPLGFLVLLSLGVVAFAAPLPPAALSDVLDVDYRSLVSAADLHYDHPASRSEEGMPIGNGRMGSLVWTTPTALKFQINRPDVFANDSASNSFPARHTDYGSGCGYVDIDVGGQAGDVFSGETFEQKLSVYDALMTARGRAVNVRVLAWPERDVLAIEVDDERAQPEPVIIDLRMLRSGVQYIAGKNAALARDHAVEVQTRNHTATSKFDIRSGRIVLTQQFSEGAYYDSSAVAIGVDGRDAKASYAGDSTVRLSVAPGSGHFTIFVGSAASFDPHKDTAAVALEQIDAAMPQGFAILCETTAGWWHDFWAKSFVRLHSADGVADEVGRNYAYFLYLMGATSRGVLPPRFNGMLWFTNGDLAEWGAQEWWANLSCYYNPLPAVNRSELMDPMFAFYSGMLDACALAARQQWGSEGIFIPEVTTFDGFEKLPDDIAAEMRDLYLNRKPWESRSERFRAFAETKLPHASRWNWKDKGEWVDGHWVFTDKGGGPFGQVTHIFSSSAKIAYLYWLRYDYTRDEAWLRDRAYPVLKGVAEFYRHFPNVRKDADGKYHIHGVNNHEPIWDAQDTQEELSAMHGVMPLLLRASEILGVDADLRPAWHEFLDNLASLPTSDALAAAEGRTPAGPDVWVGGLPPVRHGDLSRPGLVPTLYYDMCTVETADPAVVKLANATYDASMRHGVDAQTPVSVLSRIGVTAAHLGRGEDLKFLLPNQLRCLEPAKEFCDWPGIGEIAVMRNRLTMREGPGDTEGERLGRVAEALQEALLQSEPPVPGGDPILHVFPAWPKEWEGQFTLAARGAFLVTASQKQGKVEFVELFSQAGGECRLRNPWGEASVRLYRDRVAAESLQGSLLTFATHAGERIIVVPAGDNPAKYNVKIP